MKALFTFTLTLLLTACQNDNKQADCGTKTYCSEMTSCAEAKHYLNNCGVTRLDRDGDGIPCEKLCK